MPVAGPVRSPSDGDPSCELRRPCPHSGLGQEQLERCVELREHPLNLASRAGEVYCDRNEVEVVLAAPRINDGLSAAIIASPALFRSAGPWHGPRTTRSSRRRQGASSDRAVAPWLLRASPALRVGFAFGHQVCHMKRPPKRQIRTRFTGRAFRPQRSRRLKASAARARTAADQAIAQGQMAGPTALAPPKGPSCTITPVAPPISAVRAWRPFW